MTTRRQHGVALLLVLLHLLLALAYSVYNPLGEAPDEADHFAYVVHLARQRSLPEGPKVTQSKHPPLYHATAAAVTLLAEPRNDFLRANPDVAVVPGPTRSPNFFIHTTLEDWPWQGGPLAFHLARLWSVALSTLTVAAVYGLGCAALPQRPGVVLVATGIAAALPEFAFVGAAVNNDGAAALLATLALWGALLLYRDRGRLRRGWWTGPVLGLSLLAKVSTTALWPVVGLAIVLGAAQAGQENRAWPRRVWASAPRWLAAGLAVFVPALLVASPWLLRNLRLYGDPLGMALVRRTVDLRTGPWGWAETVWLIKGWFVSFWGRFGGAGHIPYSGWVYAGLAVLSGLGLVGLGVQLWRDRSVRLPVGLLALAGLAVMLGIGQYSRLALGTDQGRLLFPALGPFTLLLALGLAVWTPRWSGWAGAVLVAGLAGLAIYGLAGVIHPAFAPPPAPSAAGLAAIPAATAPIDYGEIALIGWTLDPPTAESGPVLLWQAQTAPTQDWRTTLRITAEDGSLVWEWRRSPGYGRFPTDRWRAGTRVRDAYAVGWPDWAGPGRYRVEVGLGPFPGDPVVPAAPPGAASPDHPYVFLGWLERQ